ncbi:MAG: hypothetical protein E4H20_09745 [Spirochaetales bacterium]|nr:MAG: hypothetical protein E4H20_09745 [Spirochaetales bacterium]
MKTLGKGALMLVAAMILFPASAAFAQGNETIADGLRLGIQASSDTSLGLLLRAGRIELGLQAQSMMYDGVAGLLSDNVLMVGGHACYLFPLRGALDLGIGMDAMQGIPLSGDTTYVQFLDVGLRIAFNYFVGERFMVSALVYPFRVSVRETDGAGDYSLTATLPSAAVAATVFF